MADFYTWTLEHRVVITVLALWAFFDYLVYTKSFHSWMIKLPTKLYWLIQLTVFLPKWVYYLIIVLCFVTMPRSWLIKLRILGPNGEK